MSPEPDNFGWLIKARVLNQEVLLRLYRFAKAPDKPQSDEISRSVFALLVGAGFSLWRAAFLGDATREPSKITEDAIKLLERLVRDNAVNYPQDRETREWMAGYYIKNAIWRLLMAWQFLEKEGRQEPVSAGIAHTEGFRGPWFGNRATNGTVESFTRSTDRAPTRSRK